MRAARLATIRTPAGRGAAQPGPQPGPEPSADPPADGATAERLARTRERAYQLYLERGGAAGQALDDWLRAEAQLRAEAGPVDVGDAADGPRAG